VELAGLQAFTLWALLALAVVNYARFRDVLYPPVIQAAVWLTVIALYRLNEDSFNSLSDQMYLIVLNGIVMFSAGAYVTTARYKPGLRFPPFGQWYRDDVLAKFIFWLPILGLPFYLQRSIELAANGESDFFLLNIRHAMVNGEPAQNYGMLAWLITAGVVACSIELYKHLVKPNTLKLFVSLAVAMIYAMLSSGRTSVLLLFTMLAGMMLISRKRGYVKTFLGFIVAVSLAFIAAGYWLQKGIKAETDLLDNINIMWEHIKLYVLGPLPAFDVYWSNAKDLDYGTHSFRTILILFQRLGADISAPPLVQEFVAVPMDFNVYTVYLPYLKDWGIIGVLFIQALLGMWHGYLYKNADRGEPLFIILYAMFLYPLLMQFFQDQYVSLLSVWCQAAAAAYIYFKIPSFRLRTGLAYARS
jgi:oligosaccharide repeat unit polymerase